MPSHTTLALASIVSLGALALAHPGHDHDHDHPDESALATASEQPQRRRPTRDAEPLPEPSVTITVTDTTRTITSNGIPDHDAGTFPNRHNPNAIRAQSHTWRMTTEPVAGDTPIPVRNVFGVALNGVPFDPATAEYWSVNGRTFGTPEGDDPGWNYDALGGALNLGLDNANAHVQPTGAYHYHGAPTPMLEADAMTLVGWAADGFPIYGPLCHEDPDDPTSPLVKVTPSYELKQGERPAPPEGPGGAHDGAFTRDWEYVAGSGDLDECNGRSGVTPEFPEGTYYYVLTESYPFVPRFWRAEPDTSFTQRRGPAQRERRTDRPRTRRR